MLCRQAAMRLSLMLHQLLGNSEAMTAGQPHVDLETCHYFISCLAYEDLMPSARQRRISILVFEYEYTS